MIESLLSALVTVLSGQSFFFLILGVVIGLIVGVIPGFGGTVGYLYCCHLFLEWNLFLELQ